jgi:hypothetical protein
MRVGFGVPWKKEPAKPARLAGQQHLAPRRFDDRVLDHGPHYTRGSAAHNPHGFLAGLAL